MKVIDTYNAILGAAVAVLSYVLGPHWFLFAIFLLLNVFDWITGWIKSKKTGKTSSKAGLWGIMKIRILDADHCIFQHYCRFHGTWKYFGNGSRRDNTSWMVRTGVPTGQRSKIYLREPCGDGRKRANHLGKRITGSQQSSKSG